MKSRIVLLCCLLSYFIATAQVKKYSPPKFERNSVEFLPGIWISKTEVSIAEYQAFLSWHLSKGRADEASQYALDDSVWIKGTDYNNPYTKFYNHHPAFLSYPAVGMTYEAAVAYCQYLTEKHGTMRLQGSDGKWRDVNVRFRLPSEDEWEIAACGKTSRDSAFINSYAGKIFYPRDHKGRFRFNHKLGSGDYAGYTGGDGKDFEGYMITASVHEMPEDKFLGLHHLSGNVAEMTAEKGIAKGGSWNNLQDDCRIASVNEYQKPECWLGFRVVAEQVSEHASR